MTSSARPLSAATAVALLGLPVAAALAQRAGSNDDAGALNERLILSEATVRGLTESLAVANGETELFKRKFDDLSDRIEAIGVSPVDKESGVLRSRLLSAVRDLRLFQKQNDSYREHLIGFTEAVMGLLKTSEGIDASSRMKVEESLRSASQLLAKEKSSGVEAGLTSASIVDVKPDLSLVVTDIGSRQGVRTGMPFQVWRGDRQIASARVVDVRDSISGAVIQNLSSPSDSVKAGDSLRIDTTR